MDTQKDSERLKSIGAPIVGSAHWHERLMAALACASESNPRQLNALLRTGLGVVFLFEVATWLEVARFEPALLHMERPFFIFDIALVGTGLCLTYFKWFGRNWRPVAMAFCLILMASRTLSTIAINEDEPLMLALFVLALGTAVLVPWSARWQGVLTLAGLIAFAIAAMNGVVEPMDLHRWLVLAVVGAFALSFTALKDHYRSQTILIDALLDKEKRLAKKRGDAAYALRCGPGHRDPDPVQRRKAVRGQRGISQTYRAWQRGGAGDVGGSTRCLGASGAARRVHPSN